MEKLCEKAKSGENECIIVWVNRESPKIRKGFEIDYPFLRDCDEFALTISTEE